MPFPLALDPWPRPYLVGFFGGLSLEEIGVVLDTSVATTMRDWQAARAWLFRRLSRAKAARAAPPNR